jgi:hypothetical protein
LLALDAPCVANGSIALSVCRAFVDELWELSAIIEGSYRRQPYRSSESAGWCHVTGSGSIADGGHCTR